MYNSQAINVRTSIFRQQDADNAEKALKIARNVEGVLPQIKVIENLVRTLVRREMVVQDAYERWKWYINAEDKLRNLLVYMEIFHNDDGLINKLNRYAKSWDRIFHEMKHAGKEERESEYRKSLSEGNMLKENLLEKIRSIDIQHPAAFQN